MDKKEITEFLGDFWEILNGRVADLIEFLQGLHARYPTYSRFTIETDVYQGGYDGIEHELNLCGVRLETDKEYQSRLDKTKKQREKRKKEKVKQDANVEAKDRKLYERLKKKYDD